jgi:hypothetical protein
MSLVSNLIKWTPKIVEATADDIARFGPQAARVKALLNFIPGMSDDAAKISDAAASAGEGTWRAAFTAADKAARNAERLVESNVATRAANDKAFNAIRRAAGYSTVDAASDAANAEVLSDLITPQVYRTLTNPLASARALDRLAGRAPESFIPIARDLGERGLVAAPSDIVSALRISKLPSQQQSLVTGLVDSGLTLEEAMLAARALS